MGTAAQLIGKIAQPSAAFDPLKDFAPVSLAYRGASTLTVSTHSPIRSASELVRWAKAHPGTLNYYSGGVGTAAHLLGATFSIRENIQAVHIPVHSVTDMLPQLNEQAPHFAFFITPAVRPYIDANKLRALAVTSRERSPQMPDVPTLYEIFKDDDLVQESWIGVWAPAGTPAPIVGRLFRATVQAVNSPEFKEAIARQGHVPVASDSPESFAGYVRSEYAKYARLARTAQLKPE
ncbi:hypothetical protein AWV79_24490 [Cupriavidus sp. UYMMa02A]|nr:hypothetical protein AWV79_24490 [Cupriavidus sp. UYMMa02A]